MGSARILLVEDEAIVARDIVRQLERFGHHVVGDTSRGEEAVELAAKLLPDLVLMDIQLAGWMDGIDAAQAIRRNSAVPVVFLTAFTTEPVLQRAKQASPFGYLVKPFDPQQLDTAIEIALRQHQVESSLRESREQLATILRTATDAFFLGDDRGRLIEVNEATCRLLGYTREELLALTAADLDPEEEAKEAAETTARILATGSARFERRLRRKDGSFVEVEVSANRLPLGEGRIMSFARDISARKRADEERDATVRMLKLINHPNGLDALMREVSILLRDWSGCTAVGVRLKDGDDFPYYETRGFPPEFVELERTLCERDRNGQIVRDATGNPVLECMCGNILCGRFDPSKPFFSAHGSFWTNSTTQLLSSTTEADRQARTRNRCNGEGYESVALVPLRAGETTYGLLQFNDSRKDRFTPERITLLERLGDSLAIAIAGRQEHAARQASEERFRSLLESTTDYSYAVEHRNGQQVQTRHGVGCVKVTGYTTEEFTSRPSLWFDMVVPEDRPAVLAFAGRIDRGETPAPIEHRIVHKNGSIRWVRNTVVSRPAPSDHGFMHDGLISDVTDRRRLESQLQQAQKMEAMGQLAGGVAHDFNNILATMLMELGLLREEPSLAENVRAGLRDLEASVGRATGLTRQILAFSRRQLMQMKSVRLANLLTDLHKMMGRMLGETIQVELHASPESSSIKGDGGMIEQVIMNLCVNARDAMPAGGRIELRVEDVLLGQSEIMGNPEARAGHFVRLSVTDSGYGMNEQVRQHLFEPFFTTKETGKGTGLGLSTVYGIVKQHDGWIEVESQEGKGSTFRVLLPALPVEPASSLPDAAAALARGKGETVLLVEDEASLRLALGSILRKFGYNVLDASNGDEARVKWQAQRGVIDLLITDMVMPGNTTGLQLIEGLRKEKPDLRAIICSGYLGVQSIPASTGINVLAKPFETAVLLRTVRRCLDAGATSKANP
jgi:two-component system, cell cycle sensor histidine kinase and response regulator CckA